MAKKKIDLGIDLTKKIGNTKKDIEVAEIEEKAKKKTSLKTKTDYAYKMVYLSEASHRTAKIKASSKDLSLKDYLESLIQNDPFNL